MAKPWHLQELGCPLVDWLELFRQYVIKQLISTGKFNMAEMDHNSNNYDGLSNKQLKIAANMLLQGKNGREEDDYNECKKVVMRAVFRDANLA